MGSLWPGEPWTIYEIERGFANVRAEPSHDPQPRRTIPPKPWRLRTCRRTGGDADPSHGTIARAASLPRLASCRAQRAEQVDGVSCGFFVALYATFVAHDLPTQLVDQHLATALRNTAQSFGTYLERFHRIARSSQVRPQRRAHAKPSGRLQQACKAIK